MNARFSYLSWRQLGAAIASMALGFGCASTPSTSPLAPPRTTHLPEHGISAHRGGLMGCPANTIGAFQRAICRGVHQIELDVRTTTDNVVVVAHDSHMTGKNHTLSISRSTLNEIKGLELGSCSGEQHVQHIPTLEEALDIMPKNIWINVDMKENDPRTAKLVANVVAKSNRFDQVIFAARDKAVPSVRHIAQETGQQSWIANMNRKLFRSQYIDATIESGAEFIQLIELPYLPFLRGTPSQETVDRLRNAGVRVNYSWLREQNEIELKQKLDDLFDRKVNFVLVDHVDPAMKAAVTLGISPLIPDWDLTSPSTSDFPFQCPAS